MEESRITAEGQTTLPEAVRDALSLKAGDRVRYVIDGKHVVILKVGPLSELAGAVEYDGPPATLDEMEDGIAAGASGSALTT